MTLLAVLIFILLAIYFVSLKRKSVKTNAGTLGFNGGNALAKSRKGAPKARSPWRATSIVHDNNLACDAARAISTDASTWSFTKIQAASYPSANFKVSRRSLASK